MSRKRGYRFSGKARRRRRDPGRRELAKMRSDVDRQDAMGERSGGTRGPRQIMTTRAAAALAMAAILAGLATPRALAQTIGEQAGKRDALTVYAQADSQRRSR